MEHLRTLKIVNVLWGIVLSLFAATFGLGFFCIGVSMFAKGADGAFAFMGYGLGTLALLGTLAGLHIYTGFMVTAGRARKLQTVLAVMMMGNVPLGTAYAAYALWLCHLNPETKGWFDRPMGRRVR